MHILEEDSSLAFVGRTGCSYSTGKAVAPAERDRANLIRQWSAVDLGIGRPRGLESHLQC